MKNNKKLMIGIAFFVLIIIGIVLFFALNSKPNTLSKSQKQKDLESLLGRKPNLNPIIVTGNSTYSGKHITFSYPKAAKIYTYTGNIPKGAQSETFSFDTSDPRLVFSFSEEDSSGVQNLSDIPSVTMRQNPSFGYTKVDITADGKSGIAFTKTGTLQEGAQETGYFLVDGNTFSFSVTGSILPDVEKLFNQVLDSVSFH